MSIREASEAHKAKAQGFLGEKFSILTGDIDKVRTAGTLDQALKVGDTAPKFLLPDAFGHEILLEALLAKGPVVVSFYRGEWCPFCNISLRGLQQEMPKFESLGATLVAISPEKPDHGVVLTEKNSLTFPVLSDSGNVVARQFGIVYEVGEEVKNLSKNLFKNDLAVRNGESSYVLPVPATYVIDQAGVIRFANVDPDYMTGRAEPEAVVAALEAMQSAA